MKRFLLLTVLVCGLFVLDACNDDESFPQVNANFNADRTSILVGESIAFTDSTTGEPNSWFWTIDGGNPNESTLQNPIITFQQTGEFTITLEASNSGNSDVESKPDFIRVIPEVTAEFETSLTVINEGQEVIFTDTSEGDPTSWQWNFEGGMPAISSEQNPAVTYLESGVFSVTLEASNELSTNNITKEAIILVLPIDGLQAHYPLDGSAEDLTGTYPAGIIDNAASVTNRDNLPNKALEFDGMTSNVDLGDILDEIFTGEDKIFSISLWLKTNASSANNLIISKLGDSGCSEDQRTFTIRIVNNRFNALFYQSLTSNSFRRWEGETTLEVDTWYHLVINYNGETDINNGADRLSVHIDSEPEPISLNGVEGSLGFLQNGTAHLGLGNRLDSSGDNCGTNLTFNGSIDDVRIFNRILTSSEIQVLFQE
ncbi:MAG: PKD domain-containing protein [Bacteroidota bacterium]